MDDEQHARHPFFLYRAFAARVRAPLRADADRAAAERFADAAPPFLPPLREGFGFSFLPRPEPDFLPPPLVAFTVAQARFAASLLETPRFS